MRNLRLALADTDQTERLGRSLAGLNPLPGVIYLSGELGAGKTTLSRGFIQGRGHRGAVKSPTYTLIEPYELDSGWIYHLDLYRINDPAELEYLGLEDLLAGECVCLIEWPERAGLELPPADLSILLTHANGARVAQLTAHNSRAEAWLDGISAHFPVESHLKD